MRTSDLFAPLLLAATALAQGPPEGIAPDSQPPSGCTMDSSSNFTIGTLKVGSKKRETASEAADANLVCSLSDGILRDTLGRTGSVVANRQFQFDGPPQAGAVYTGGFSICSNGSLAIGGTTRWWRCSSGDFFNLYDDWIGDQCEEIRIQVAMEDKEEASPSANPSTGSEATTMSTAATSTRPASTGGVGAVESSASASANGSVTSAAMSVSTPASATLSGATTTGSLSATPGAADAPPAGGAAPASFGVAKGSMAAAFVVIFGAALVL